MCFFLFREPFAAPSWNGTGLKPAAVGHEVFMGTGRLTNARQRSLECVNRQRPGGSDNWDASREPQAHASAY